MDYLLPTILSAAGSDYTTVSLPFTFNSEATQLSFNITILDDGLPEETESFRVAVRTEVDNIAVFLPEDVVISIEDDDQLTGFIKNIYQKNNFNYNFLFPVGFQTTSLTVEEAPEGISSVPIVVSGPLFADVVVQISFLNDSLISMYTNTVFLIPLPPPASFFFSHQALSYLYS